MFFIATLSTSSQFILIFSWKTKISSISRRGTQNVTIARRGRTIRFIQIDLCNITVIFLFLDMSFIQNTGSCVSKSRGMIFLNNLGTVLFRVLSTTLFSSLCDLAGRTLKFSCYDCARLSFHLCTRFHTSTISSIFHCPCFLHFGRPRWIGLVLGR